MDNNMKYKKIGFSLLFTTSLYLASSEFWLKTLSDYT